MMALIPKTILMKQKKLITAPDILICSPKWSEQVLSYPEKMTERFKEKNNPFKQTPIQDKVNASVTDRAFKLRCSFYHISIFPTPLKKIQSQKISSITLVLS